jgi:surface antigen
MRLRLTAALAAALTSSAALAAPTFAHAADPIGALIARDAASAPVQRQTVASSDSSTGWQCAQFARLFSGIQIFGDAWTWWNQALGKYARGFTPQAGSVLVFKPSGAMTRGHVAVVSQVLTDRIIQVTHANWSMIHGERGQVEKDVTVVDVSKAGDWSAVKVWYDPTGDLGRTVYPTYGFVYKAAADAAQRVAGVFGGSSASN